MRASHRLSLVSVFFPRMVEIGPDLGAFREARHLGAWAGVAPGNNTSAGKRRYGRARPGNPTLRATDRPSRPPYVCVRGAFRSKKTLEWYYKRAQSAGNWVARHGVWW